MHRSGSPSAYVLTLFLVLILAGQAFGGIIRAKSDSPNDGPGNDWDHAYRTITAALAAAVAGDEVWVAKGTYVERVTVGSSIGLYGGFGGTEESREQRSFSANTTVIDGSKGGAVVTTAADCSSETRIDGFTIRNGSWSSGGGIFCQGSPTIANNIITQNVGGGIRTDIASSSSATISNNLIAANPGGGIALFGGSVVVSNNTIVANTESSNEGGGVHINGGSHLLSNNVIAGNSWGVYLVSGSPILRNNDVYNPDGLDYSGGISAGAGDISVDPGFACYAAGDYHLQPDSPCADAGLNEALGVGSVDLDGKPRVQPAGGKIDIGAYECDGVARDDTLPVVVCVDPVSGSDSNDGSSWQSAKKTIGAAIGTASAAAGEVWAKAGVYNERVTLKTDVYLYGGFVGTESARGERDWNANATVLDGGGQGSVVTVSDIPWGRAAIDGFTIRNGNAANGGGICCSRTSLQISNNIITGNTASSNGGGIYWDGHYLTMIGNTISKNAANNGGGIWGNSDVAISGNTITGNTASGYGGGIKIAPGSYSRIARIANNRISDNSATYGGGGIEAGWPVISPNGIDLAVMGNTISRNSSGDGGGVYCQGCRSILVSGNMITSNSASQYGGGAYFLSTPPLLTNNTVADNATATNGGGVYMSLESAKTGSTASNNIIAYNSTGIYLTAGSTVTLRNNDVYNPGGTNYYGVSAGSGDISADPGFVSRFCRDFHIQPGSPCTDAGWNGAAGIGDADIDGQPRVQPTGGTIDMGADECDGITRTPPTPITIRVDGENGEDTNDGLTWASAKRTVQSGVDTASAQGGDVWVRAGVYHERIALKPHVNLLGGFAGTETTRDERDWSANPTTLDGDSAGTVVTALCSFFSAIDGFTIRNGKTINGGGGIDCQGVPTLISNNRIVGNSGSGGGGIRLSDSASTICNNVIWSNSISGASSGGGIYCYRSAATICSNTITANVGRDYSVGGAIASAFCAPMIVNNIIAFNSSGLSSGGGSPTLRNNDVYNPSGTDYSGVSAGVGDISVDPKFVAVKYADFHIQADSPCRDAGWTEAPSLGSADMDCRPRIFPAGGSADIGADEWDATPSPAVPAVMRVDGVNGNDANDGSSWALSKKTIQAAIDGVSVLGGEVWVKAGTYSRLISLKQFASVFGGFAGTETSRDTRDWRSNLTTIDGNAAGSVVTASNIGPGFATIDGFTIQNGKTTGNGGGISCSCFAGTISHNTIARNSAVNGGGIWCNFSPATVMSNTITNNTATSGGGIRCDSSACSIAGNVIAKNTSTSAGAAISCVTSPTTMVVNTISNNTIVGNTTPSAGGGIYCTSYSASSIANNIVAFNSSGIVGSSITLRNNDIYNPGGRNYWGKSAGDGDISVDPLFANRLGGDYHLRPMSPSINAGWSDAAGISSTDMDGEGRVNGIVDIGADEYWAGTARTIPDAKAASAGVIDIYGGIVTAGFTDSFYIESDDRASGVLVRKQGHTLNIGDRARVIGNFAVEDHPERYIQATAADATGTGTVAPLAMPNSSVGGGTSGLQNGVWGWVYTKDASGQPTKIWDRVTGLNNLGLLITTCGRVTEIQQVTEPDKPMWFTIDDGSDLDLQCLVPEGVTINPAWQYVRVTGISSCKRVGTELHAVVKVRTQADIVGF